MENKGKTNRLDVKLREILNIRFDKIESDINRNFVDSSVEINYETRKAIEKQIREHFIGMLPKREEHICVLSIQPLYFIEGFKEGRTIKDWVKFGRNQAIDEMKKNMKGE